MEFLGGVVEGDDALRIEHALGVPADKAHPEAVLGGADLGAGGVRGEVSADVHAGGQHGEAVVRELTVAGDPEARAIGGALLTAAIPGEERVDQAAGDGQGVRAVAVMAKSDLAAFASDVEAQRLDVPLAQGDVDDARAQQEAVVAAEAHAGLFEDEVLDDVSLEAAQPEPRLALLHEVVELRPVLLGDEDGVAAHARGADVEPVGRADQGDAERAEDL